MPLCIKDQATTQCVNVLARQRGTNKQDAVKVAVQAELERGAKEVPLRVAAYARFAKGRHQAALNIVMPA